MLGQNWWIVPLKKKKRTHNAIPQLILSHQYKQLKGNLQTGWQTHLVWDRTPALCRAVRRVPQWPAADWCPGHGCGWSCRENCWMIGVGENEVSDHLDGCRGKKRKRKSFSVNSICCLKKVLSHFFSHKVGYTLLKTHDNHDDSISLLTIILGRCMVS